MPANMEVVIFQGKMFSPFEEMASIEQSSNSFALDDRAFRALDLILTLLLIRQFQNNQHDDIVLTGQAVLGDPFRGNLK